MEPRFGRLYASAVLRPLAEQLVAALGVQPGDTTCDLVCDGGTLGVALGAATGVDGEVLLVDCDPAVVAAAGTDVVVTGCAVSMLVTDADVASVASASCDRVGSLCTAGFWDGSSLFDEAGRMLGTGGSAAIVTWDASRPPAHEAALSDALRDVAGVEPDFLRRCVPEAPAAPEHWDTTVLRDVVRFDGITHYWAAMVVERAAIATELAGTSLTVQSAVRDACERALQPYSAADGTLRIPVTATMLRSTAR